MAMLTYALCAFASLACAVMLLMRASRNGSRMLFWSGWCFAGLALSNGLIVVDAFTRPELGVLRLSVSLLAVALLLYGLIVEEK